MRDDPSLAVIVICGICLIAVVIAILLLIEIGQPPRKHTVSLPESLAPYDEGGAP